MTKAYVGTKERISLEAAGHIFIEVLDGRVGTNEQKKISLSYRSPFL